MRDFLIDTDTASDDAVALIMALRQPDVAVRCVTTVSGNVECQQAARNALVVAELCGSDVPVFVGCHAPMLRPASDASWFHSADGLSDRGFGPERLKPAAQHGVDALREFAHRYPGCTLVTLGPLTNVAMAIIQDSHFAGNIGRCVVMGGNPCCVGNVTPAAEYNIWCDPEAAQIVCQSGMRIEWVGWHVSRGDAVLNAGEIDALLATPSPLARFAVECNRTAMRAYETQTGEKGISLPDAVAMAVAIDPSIVTHASDHRVLIECASELTRGMTVVDQLNVGGDARNAGRWCHDVTPAQVGRIVWTMDVPAYKRQLLAALGGA